MDQQVIIANFFMQVIFPVLGALLLALLGKFMHYLAANKKAEWLTSHQNELYSAAYRAINFAEEVAYRKLKEGSGKITGKDKMDQALLWMMEHCPQVSAEKAENIIHTLLGERRQYQPPVALEPARPVEVVDEVSGD